MTITAAQWVDVEDAQSGDRDAFARIYTNNHERIYRFVQHRVPRREVAEDITADAFTHALAKISSVEYRGRDVGAWINTIARNLANDYHRSAHTKRCIPVDPALGDVGFEDGGPLHPWAHGALFIDYGTDPAEAAVHTGNARHLRYAIGFLTDEQATCIQHRYFEDLSVAETAVLMGLTEGAVKALTYRAIVTLRRELDGRVTR